MSREARRRRPKRRAQRGTFEALLVALVIGVAAVGRAETESAAPTESRFPEPRDVTFMTSDGVYIVGTYYESAAGAESPAVLCLHQLYRNRKSYARLARLMQVNGTAVLSIDLRGHGQSTQVNYEVYRKSLDDDEDDDDEDDDRERRGKERRSRPQTIKRPGQTLDAKTFRQVDFRRMLNDAEAGKRFLVRENNNKKLNIRRLAVIGASIGATTAVRQAAYDWKFGPGEGRDIKALVLLSPGMAYRGINIAKRLRRISTQLPIMTIVGKNDKQSYASATRVANMAALYKGGLGAGAPKPLYELPTNLHGTDLLAPDFKLEKPLVAWIKARLERITPIPRWEKRELNPVFED